jgi:hypothetical protein
VTPDRVLIIELNPFFSDTGACLFSWKSANDRHIIQNGPFELRVVKSPLSSPYLSLPAVWAQWMCQQRHVDYKALMHNERLRLEHSGSSSSSSIKKSKTIVTHRQLVLYALVAAAAILWTIFGRSLSHS